MVEQVIRQFEDKFNLKMVTQEAGFQEIVTGFIPKDGCSFINIDNNLTKEKPKDAYNHSNIMAVKGYGFGAKLQLFGWIKSLGDLNNVKIISSKRPNSNWIEVSELGNEIFKLKKA